MSAEQAQHSAASLTFNNNNNNNNKSGVGDNGRMWSHHESVRQTIRQAGRQAGRQSNAAHNTKLRASTHVVRRKHITTPLTNGSSKPSCFAATAISCLWAT
jgi:hypothetical protein